MVLGITSAAQFLQNDKDVIYNKLLKKPNHPAKKKKQTQNANLNPFGVKLYVCGI